MVLVAQSEAPIAAALQLDPGRSFARLPAASQLDGDVAIAGMMDMSSNVQLWAGDSHMLDGFEVVRDTPVLGGSLRVDAQGLYSAAAQRRRR